MLTSIMAALKLPDLRKRIFFLFGMFAVFVVGLHIPVPGIDREAMAKLFEQGTLLGLVDVFSGGALRKFTILAMGIAPYINASIIMQLLTVAVPQLEALAKEGEHGRKKISQYTRYLTVLLAAFQAAGTNKLLQSAHVLQASPIMFLQIVIALTAGTAFLMWVGEQITDKGIGNGVSLVIFAGIVASLPFQLGQTWDLFIHRALAFQNILAMVILFLATVVGIVAIQQAQRKIPIQHVKRVVGNKMYGGSTSFLPLRVNSAGVIPIIFALSIQLFPMTIAQFLGTGSAFGQWFTGVARAFSPGNSMWAGLLYAAFIIFFTYFYTAVTFNVPEVADNLKKYGSFIPGIRPGKPTLEYLDRVMSRITLAGAIFLAVIALMQYWSPAITGVQTFSLVGGTSLLIIVGVALETMQAVEAHLLMRHYEGFIK
ncbi:MAG TPA: preprotein translocase subunit SecY [Armatimonadota bacterium]|nr:preprotein translocase subunit SecY [Armatimonadota bacterium]